MLIKRQAWAESASETSGFFREACRLRVLSSARGQVQVAGPRELVHGERESFIGGYRRQHSGLVVGSPAMNAGGGGCSRASSRR